MNDILEFIKDLEEIKIDSSKIDTKIQKYQKVINDFEESQDNLYNTNFFQSGGE